MRLIFEKDLEGKNMTKLLRINDIGYIEYPEKDGKSDWPFSTDLADTVANGLLKNITTTFVKVGTKPEGCKDNVWSELEKMAIRNALCACDNLNASYVALSKDSVNEIQSRATGETMYATYVATFYSH